MPSLVLLDPIMISTSLNQSPLFIQQLRGEGQVQYHVNGRQYNNGYYLADGICPEWAAFVKSICHP